MAAPDGQNEVLRRVLLSKGGMHCSVELTPTWAALIQLEKPGTGEIGRRVQIPMNQQFIPVEP